MKKTIEESKPTTEGRAVRTTIVGGRPPVRGDIPNRIPRGIEVLVKKAAVDSAFRQRLLDKRAKAAREIELNLTMAETLMLDTIPQAQLTSIIDNTQVPDQQRRAFLGKAAAVMLSAIGATACRIFDTDKATLGIRPETPQVEGIRPDDPTATPDPNIETGSRPDDPTATPIAPTGSRPDDPTTPDDDAASDDAAKKPPAGAPPAAPRPYVTRGIQPDYPFPEKAVSKGIRPDLPKPKRSPGDK